MLIKFLTSIILTFTISVACTQSPKKTMQDPTQKTAAQEKSEFQHVREDLYGILVDHIRKNKISADYWIFYSSSGWGPAYGQFEVADNHTDKITIKYEYKGKKGTLKVDKDHIAALKGQAQQWGKLSHLNPPIFDSYRYNMFRMVAKKGDVQVLYKLYANAPDLEGGTYMQVVRTFQKLIPEEGIQ